MPQATQRIQHPEPMEQFSNGEKLARLNSVSVEDAIGAHAERLMIKSYINSDKLPSKTYGTPWLYSEYEGDDPKVPKYFIDRIEYAYKPERMPEGWYTGKWLLFVDTDKINDVWSQVKTLVQAGKLWRSAKVSTQYDTRNRKQSVICVYTPDYSVHIDVRRIRYVLYDNLGITKKIPYKSDYRTMTGKTGSLYYY